MIKWKRGNNYLWYRNMPQLWSKYDVEIISDVIVPKNIDDSKVHLTLIRKNQ